MDIARGDNAVLTRIAAVAVRQDRRAQSDIADDEARQRRRGGVGDDLDPTAARALASDLDRDRHHERLAVDELAAAAEPELLAADERLVDLDRARQRLPVRIDHRPAQLVEDQPGRRVARQPEHVLELESRQPGLVGGHPVGRPEPGQERRPGAVQDRAGRDRDPVGARLALPEPPAR